MQVQLEDLQPKLVVASKETDELMVNIKQKSEEADKERAVVEVESAKCSKIAEEV